MVDFSNYNLSNANFEYAVFSGGNLFHANITDSYFSFALVENATWTNGITFGGGKTCLQGTVFEDLAGKCN